MSLTPITISQLLKKPKSIQNLLKKGGNLAVFSRSKLIFEIHSPAHIKSKKVSTLKLPTISVPMEDTLNREEMYSNNSWLENTN